MKEYLREGVRIWCNTCPPTIINKWRCESADVAGAMCKKKCVDARKRWSGNCMYISLWL